MKKISLGAVLFVLLFAANVFAQPSWTAQTSPVTTDLNSVWAPSTDVCWMCGPTGVVIRTTNGGSTWTQNNAGLAGNDFYSIYAFDADNCWAGAGDGGLWHTTNGGANWSFITLSPATPFIDGVYFFDANNGFCFGDPSASQWRYYITTNGGANWTLGSNAPASVGSEAGWNNSWESTDTANIWWGTNVNKIWHGGFKGPFTSQSSGSASYVFGIAFNDASTGCSIVNIGGTTNAANQITTNGGTTWTNSSFTPNGVAYGIRAVHGTGYMWLVSASAIARSTNSGNSFTSQFTLPAGQTGYGVGMANINCGWVCTATGKIYKYTDNVGIEPPITTPTKFELKQNYPNPFNPQTSIDFSLAQTGYVSLKIYNMLGQEVMTLIDGVETAGSHTTTFNATNLPSGTYFYTMKSGDNTATKSLVLVK